MTVAECTLSRTDARIRRMKRAEVEICLAWAAEEGWNPGVHDAEPFYRADPHGFFACELDGHTVGTVSAVRYDDSFGFIGFLIVQREFRGGRFGPALIRAAMKHLNGCNVGLDGVLAKIGNYQALGFKQAYRNIRFQGTTETRCTAPHAGIVDLGSVPFEMLAAYDCRFFPVSRNAFLQAWIAQPVTVAVGLMEDDVLKGYGVIRPCMTGYKIGPLFADGPDEAESICRALTSHAPGQPVFLDVPEVNQAALDLARRHGMSKVFETARMYTHEPPAIDLDGVFGVTSFELG